MWERKEAARFLGDVLEVGQAERLADDVEKIAMLSGRGIGPFARSALAGFQPGQAHEHRTAGAVLNVADDPVSSGAAAGRQVVAADRLGIATETACQFGSIMTGHYAASRSPMRCTDQRSSSLPRTTGPLASTGTNMRSFHEMIS